MNTLPSPPRSASRRAVWLVQLLAVAIVASTLVAGGSACSSTKDLGRHGNARRSDVRGWMLSYSELELDPVPLTTARSYQLTISGLQGMHISNFRLAVQTPRSAMRKASQTPGSAPNPVKPKFPVIRFTVFKAGGEMVFTDTVGQGKRLWEPWDRDKNGYPVLLADLPGPQKKMDETGDLTLLIEILRPGEIPGQYLNITSQQPLPR